MSIPEDRRLDLVRYRIEKSHESMTEAEWLIQGGFYTGAANRLYYAIFHMADALMVLHRIEARTHQGLQNQFYLHFVRTGKMTPEENRLYSVAMDMRLTGDYSDKFFSDPDDVVPFVAPIKEMTAKMERLIQEEIKSLNSINY